MNLEEVMDNISFNLKSFSDQNNLRYIQMASLFYNKEKTTTLKVKILATLISSLISKKNKDVKISTVIKFCQLMNISIFDLTERKMFVKDINTPDEHFIQNKETSLIERIENLEMQIQTILNFINKEHRD